MDNKKIASTIVLYFYQGNGEKKERWLRLATELGMQITEQDIEFGISNVFTNNEKKWADWEKEGGIGKQLYGLRMFVANALHRLNQFPLLDKYEDEVYRVELEVYSLVKHLKKLGVRFKNKTWWEFWK